MSSSQLPRLDCPFCNWHGPNNQYPKHLAECSAKTDADDSRAGTALRADGGRREVSAGDLVVDRDADRPRSLAVVLDTVNIPAEEFRIDALEQTVAEANPGYPADAHVAVIAFVEDLNDALDDYSKYTTAKLRAHTRTADIRTYTYPMPRLKPAERCKSTTTPGGDA
jgi:hypothetical protein